MNASEVIAKLLLSLPLLALLALLWRSEMDLARLAPGRLLGGWLTLHEPDAVYQAGKVVGRVEGAEISEAERLVTFRAIYQTAPMAVGQPFVFRGLALQPRAIEHMELEQAGPSEGARVLQGVTCEILGPG